MSTPRNPTPATPSPERPSVTDRKSPEQDKPPAVIQQPEAKPEHALDYRLKSSIDERGRYSVRLDDMSAGLAAGRNLPHPVARKAIEDSFTQRFGLSPQAYLDKHYENRRELMRDVSQEMEQHRPEQGHKRGR